MRASDSDRERTAELLREHYTAGRLSSEDLARRVDSAYDVGTVDELAALTADLPSPDANAVTPRRASDEEMQGFRVHFTIYALVNLLLIGIWAASGAGYFWPIWPILGWGFGIAMHAAPLLARRGQAPAVAAPRDDGDSSVEEVATSVAAERPSLGPAAAPDGTVTILFSDIEGSTALNDRLGDLRWLELLRAHHAIVREQIARHDGFEVKAQGDGFMIAFPSARRAVDCARAIQRAIDTELGRHPDGPIRLRIGLHTGEAIRQEADFYGKNVVMAARIADHARGGEILVSSVVKQLTESAGDIEFGAEREVELPGLAGTHTVYPVV